MVPMWTPTNQLSKAAAIEVLFPRKIEAICYIPEELPPLQVNIIVYLINTFTLYIPQNTSSS